ncbi:hypothetical protein FHT87_005221 [Rhizobium sp. BK316]|uniref:hypothetical protein n=1 Tax=Rhizobium sp. BK316 TaxID=2587053 RepID=UPI0016166F70|nr:hypothetical protein [Rhizobium sp. BK316]MBB3411268.1 hypothetical protein [Rhizobium sp. BK316]
MTIFCSMRTVECTCTQDECRAAKPQSLAAELMVPSWKTQLAVCVFGGVIAGITAFGILGSQEGYFKQIDLAQQESRRG